MHRSMRIRIQLVSCIAATFANAFSRRAGRRTVALQVVDQAEATRMRCPDPIGIHARVDVGAFLAWCRGVDGAFADGTSLPAMIVRPFATLLSREALPNLDGPERHAVRRRYRPSLVGERELL
jgi:hypothetical protein